MKILRKNFAEAEPSRRAGTPIPTGDVFRPPCAASNQKQIDQRDQGRADAGSDQGIVGAEAALGVERCWVGFLGHFGGLEQAGPGLCEADHIPSIFFKAKFRERVVSVRIGIGRGLSGADKAQAMGQQIQPWRAGDGGRLWLSMLVDTMERISRPEFRSIPCDRSLIAAVSAQLSLPAPAYLHGASHFSLRN